MSEIKVNSIKGVAASVAALSINNTDGTCTANITNNLSNKNLIINGAMNVAQRGTSSTSGGYQTVDRMPVYHTGGAVTQSQESLTSGSPFEKGFTKYLRLTNTTANTGTNVARSLIYKIEAQDIANSGWNYKSSLSYITISFWVRSSVSQQFYIMARTQDGTSQAYPFSLGTLSADTWTKVTHSISGNSNLQFDNNNDRGLEFFLYVSLGTDFTSSSVTLNAWGAYTSSARLPDYTNSWAAATNATFDITGMQLEVGSVATDFEHLSFADDLRKCQRYYFIYADGSEGSNAWQLLNIHGYSSGQLETTIDYSCANLRAIPELKQGTGTNWYNAVNANASITWNSFLFYQPSKRKALLYTNSTSGTTHGVGTAYRCQFGNNGAYIALDAEL